MLQLFFIPTTPASAEVIPIIATPLGEIRFDLMLAGEPISTLAHSRSHHLTYRSARALRWETSAFEAELLLFRPEVHSSIRPRIDDVHAAIWRLRAREDLPACTFTALWQPGFTWVEGGANHGQHLDAQSFTDETHQLSLGTEDGEVLEKRAADGDWMPPRFAPLFRDDPYAHIEYLPEGFCITLPNLLARESCQLHFLTAWAPRSEDIGDSLAVDQPYRDLLP